MTKEQIAELRRLDEEAFSPPWALSRGVDGRVLSIDSVRAGRPGTQYVFGPADEPPLFDSDSAEFVVAIRNALPKLLDEREALLEAVRFSLNTKQEDGHEEWERLEAALAKADSP